MMKRCPRCESPMLPDEIRCPRCEAVFVQFPGLDAILAEMKAQTALLREILEKLSAPTVQTINVSGEANPETVKKAIARAAKRG